MITQHKRLTCIVSFITILLICACSTTEKQIAYDIPYSPDPTTDSLQIYSIDEVDQKPTPTGGFRKLQREINYPKKVRRAGVSGKVVVSFVVTPTGKTMSGYIDSSPHPLLSIESLRVIRNASFEPGMKDGKNVNTWTSMPLRFKVMTLSDQ